MLNNEHTNIRPTPDISITKKYVNKIIVLRFYAQGRLWVDHKLGDMH